MDKLLILLQVGDTPRVAGLPAAVRAANAAGALSPGKVIFCGPGAAAIGAWRAHLGPARNLAFGLNGENAAAQIAAGSPLLAVSSEGFPGAEGLVRFEAQARSSGKNLRWVFHGRTVAAYYPDASALLGQNPAAVEALENGGAAYESADWWPVNDQKAVARAEKHLFSKLPKDTDGYLARFDRKISMAVSRVLIETPVTPNQITTASLLIGLLGSWWLATGAYPMQVLAAFLLWSCCILDGCDGEVARLKHLCSPGGGLYDVVSDNIVHVAIFVAIPWNIHHNKPEAHFLLAGILLVTGLLACMFSVWHLVLRRPESERGAAGLVVERVASRDFIYLIFLLTLLGRLDWFLWTAGIGSHLFNLVLWAIFLRTPKGPSL